MAGMLIGKGRARWHRGLTRMLLAAALAGVWLPGAGTARQFDHDAAETALNQARALRKKLAADQSTGRDEYLRCIRLYRRVFTSDPHFQGSDDAVYEAATLYQEMAAKFAAPEYDLEAIQLLRFLMKEYPASQYRPYAILRLAAIGPAQEARGSTPSVPAPSQAQVKALESESKPEPPSEKSPAELAGAPAAAIRGIHYSSKADRTTVTIELDEHASYQEQRISNPDRIFFDFSDTWLVLDTSGSAVVVNDRFLRRIRAAQYRPGTARVVLDLAPGVDCTVSEMSNPFRIVVDIRKGQ